MDRPKIVVTLGSTKFKDQHMGHAQKETLKGNIVLSPGFYHHVDRCPITDDQKKQIDELVLRKIDLADEIIVINPNGYMGASTSKAVQYARDLGKTIRFTDI